MTWQFNFSPFHHWILRLVKSVRLSQCLSNPSSASWPWHGRLQIWSVIATDCAPFTRYCWPQADFVQPDNTSQLKYDWIKNSNLIYNNGSSGTKWIIWHEENRLWRITLLSYIWRKKTVLICLDQQRRWPNDEIHPDPKRALSLGDFKIFLLMSVSPCRHTDR